MKQSDIIAVSVMVDSLAQDSVSACLMDLGCDAVEFMDEKTLRAYFPATDIDEKCLVSNIKGKLNLIKDSFPWISEPQFSVTHLEDSDWANNWKQFFKPVMVTEKLLICPPWEELPEQHTATEIIIMDPGLAFGTGSHPTTRMCLAAIETIEPCGSKKFLDVGTGSGILSIYAIRCGYVKALGIDIDPDALQWAEKNLILNNMQDTVSLSEIPLGELNESFYLVAANLILDEILLQLSALEKVVQKSGYLILSGLLASQLEEVKSALKSFSGIIVIDCLFQEEWASLICKKL